MAPELKWITPNGESLGVYVRVLAFLRPGLLAQAQHHLRTTMCLTSAEMAKLSGVVHRTLQDNHG